MLHILSVITEIQTQAYSFQEGRNDFQLKVTVAIKLNFVKWTWLIEMRAGTKTSRFSGHND